uniref:Uncharacterized protein n=1 Tax=Anguilla anguilla TaxID=7936 RepID=A0A0E9T5F6_ANGAN
MKFHLLLLTLVLALSAYTRAEEDAEENLEESEENSSEMNEKTNEILEENDVIVLHINNFARALNEKQAPSCRILCALVRTLPCAGARVCESSRNPEE